MKVERLICGWFTAPAGIFRRGDSMDATIRYPVPCYLIETATERVLIDTGLNPDAVPDPAAYYERPDVFARVTLEQERSIVEQIDVATLSKVVLTHLHWDHVGGLSLIPVSVPVVVQRSEWEAGRDDTAIRRNAYLSRDYSESPRDVILVDGDHDLFGDGSIELLYTPGHTPGHQSLRIDGRLVLAGDVVHFASGLDDCRFPIFADDHAEQTRSARRLRDLRSRGHRVVPGHDPATVRPEILIDRP